MEGCLIPRCHLRPCNITLLLLPPTRPMRLQQQQVPLLRLRIAQRRRLLPHLLLLLLLLLLLQLLQMVLLLPLPSDRLDGQRR